MLLTWRDLLANSIVPIFISPDDFFQWYRSITHNHLWWIRETSSFQRLEFGLLQRYETTRSVPKGTDISAYDAFPILMDYLYGCSACAQCTFRFPMKSRTLPTIVCILVNSLGGTHNGGSRSNRWILHWYRRYDSRTWQPLYGNCASVLGSRGRSCCGTAGTCSIYLPAGTSVSTMLQ